MTEETTPQAFVRRVRAAEGECVVYKHGNQSGVLWERLWKFQGDKFWTKVCAPGCYPDWVSMDERDAVRTAGSDFEIMGRQ